MKLHGVKECLDANDANLSGSSFVNVNLSGARIHNANCSGLSIDDVNLSGTRLTNANLSGMAFSVCQFHGATIDGIPITDLLRVYHSTAKVS